MKTAGIITEYNPFHNGHLYHIQKTRELTGADFVIAVMSGDFVQRGAPALFDKYTRTEMALRAGVDLALELPSVFAVSSAEDFAAAGVALLDKLGIVDAICFGSESGDIRALSAVADILIRESEKYTEEIQFHLKNGTTFPKARSLAVNACMGEGTGIGGLLDSPNNILGIEYLKAQKCRNSSMKAVTITRAGNGYHDEGMDGPFCSATAIRKVMASAKEDGLQSVETAVPEFVFDLIRERCPVFPDDFSDILNYVLLSSDRQGFRLDEYADVSGDLAARLGRLTLDFLPFEERIAALKTRQYTYTRISRALLHLILEIKTEELVKFRAMDYVPYARVLGFRRDSAAVMKEIKNLGSIPLITKVADARQLLSGAEMELFEKDLFCSHLYQSVVQRKSGQRLKNEYTRGCVMI